MPPLNELQQGFGFGFSEASPPHTANQQAAGDAARQEREASDGNA